MTDRFARRVVVLDGGVARAYDAAEWRHALVTIERGAVELEAVDGGRRVRFGAGDVVALDRLALRALHNPGDDPAVLAVVARRLRAVR